MTTPDDAPEVESPHEGDGMTPDQRADQQARIEQKEAEEAEEQVPEAD